MKPSHNRFCLYLENDCLDLATLVNKNKRLHAFCNDYDLFLNTLAKNNIEQVDIDNILNDMKEPVITKMQKNHYCELMRGKVFFVNIEDHYAVFYMIDRMLNLKKKLSVEDFKTTAKYFDEIGINFSVSQYGYKKLCKYLRLADSHYDIPEKLADLLQMCTYKGGYYINRFPNTMIEGKFYDYDINSAYLDELKNLSFARPIYECKNINDVPLNARWIAFIDIYAGKCKTNFPIRFDKTNLIKDFSANRFCGLIADVEFNDLKNTYFGLKYNINTVYYNNPSTIKIDMNKLIKEVYDLKTSKESWKKTFGKCLYTQMIGTLSSKFKAITRGNLYHQFILADVRSKVRNMAIKIEEAGYLVYYIDTDGFSTNCPPEVMEELGFKISKNVGDLKIERQGYNFMATAECKQYLWQDEEFDIDYVIAGAPEKEVGKNLAIYKNAIAILDIRKEGRKYKEKFNKFLSKCSMHICHLFDWWSRFAYQNISYNDSAGLYYWDSISNLQSRARKQRVY